MADFRDPADLLLKNFFDKVSGPLRHAKIEMASDLQLHQQTDDLFSCSVVLTQGAKKLPPEKIYVSFSSFPMIKFFGRTWTEFQGEQGIAPFLTGIQDHFRQIKV